MVVAVQSMILNNDKGSDPCGPITSWTIVVIFTTLSMPLHCFAEMGKNPFFNHIF